MKPRKEKIVEAALELFAEEGYKATSTSKVAAKAGVSEGLIFRHFKNKEGLLQAILDEGEEQLGQLLIPILEETDPKQVIRKSLELPFMVKESDLAFWKLQFKLKWELEYEHSHKMQPLKDALSLAFDQLGYASPEMEADFIIHFLDGVSGAIIKGILTEKEQLKNFLIEKYKV